MQHDRRRGACLTPLVAYQQTPNHKVAESARMTPTRCQGDASPLCSSCQRWAKR